MLSTEAIERVRQTVDVVRVVGSHLELRQQGVAHVGRCPFHRDSGESLRVYANERRFICFSCGARGDVFEFLKRLERKAFPVVVRELAAGAQVPLETVGAAAVQDSASRAHRLALLSACEAATRYWEESLRGPEGEQARRYLAGRGINEGTARAFRLGYAVPEWHAAQRALDARDVSSIVQRDAGLLAAKEVAGKSPRLYDRFRDRVVLPIQDVQGRVIGFGGRAIAADAEPRYLNGPETPIFKKSEELYGVHQARNAIRRTGGAILVEGFFDVVAMHQAGFRETVGCCGTRLSLRQVELLSKCGCRDLVLLFDADEAGRRAAWMAAPSLLAVGISATVASCERLPDQKTDPASLLQHAGAGPVKRALGEARALTDYVIGEAVAAHGGGSGTTASVEAKVAIVRELLPLVVAIPEGLARSAFEKAIARRLDVHIGSLRQEVLREESTRNSG